MNSLWQTSEWGEMLKATGQVEEILSLPNFFIEKRRVALGEYGLFVLGSKLPTPDEEQALIDLARRERVLFVQLESFSLLGNQHLKTQYFQPSTYKKFITPFTAIIDLSQTEEEILASMKPKGRYNIKIAQKKGIMVESVAPNDENIACFHALLAQTTKRDGFCGNTKEYYKKFVCMIPHTELIFAKLGDNVLAGGIFVFSKDVSLYYYGASTSDSQYRNMMAPYLLQWTAIKKAKASGSMYYDFLGVAPHNDTKNPLAGVTDFKLKFTQDVRYVSEGGIYIVKKWKYRMIDWLRKMKG